MKLPKITNQVVQSVGRHKTGAVSQLASATAAKGNANQKAFNLLADVGSDFLERKQNSEYNDAVASMQVNMNAFQAQHGAKDFYKADELGNISEDLVPRITKSFENGIETSTIRNSIPAYEVYPHLLRQELEGQIELTASKITNPILRNKFMDDADVNASTQMMKAMVASENEQQAYTIKVGTSRALTAGKNGELDMGLWQIEQLELPELEKEDLRNDVRKLDEGYEVTQAIRSSDDELITTVRSRLEDPNYDGWLSERERQGAVSDLTARMKQVDAEEVAERNFKHASFINMLVVGIKDNQVTRMDIDALYDPETADPNNPNALTPPEHSALVGQLAASQRGSEAAAWESAFFDDMMAGKVYMNPDRKEQQDAVDNTLARRGLNDPEFLVTVVAKSSYMPKVLVDNMAGAALNSNEPESVKNALEVYGRLNDSAPHMLKKLSGNADTVLGMAAQMVRTGSDPMQAVTDARTLLAEAPEKKEIRETMYAAAIKENPNVDALKDQMAKDTSLFDLNMYYTADVDPSPEMLAEYNVEVNKQFMLTGDMETARNLAYNQNIRRNWSISGVGSRMKDGEMSSDPRSQKNSVERTLNVSTKQANAALKEWAHDEDLDFHNLQVFSDPTTARDGSSWAIVIVDPVTGMMKPHSTRWSPRATLRKNINAEIDQSQAEANVFRLAEEEIFESVTGSEHLPPGFPQ